MKNALNDRPAEVTAPLTSVYVQQQPQNSRNANETKLVPGSNGKEGQDPCALLAATVMIRRHQRMTAEKQLSLPHPAHPGTLQRFDPPAPLGAYRKPGLVVVHPEQPCPDTFRVLMASLRKRGIDTTAFRRSTRLRPLLRQYSVELTEEVALISPQALPAFVHQENLYSRVGLNLVVVALLATLGLGIAHSAMAYWTAGLILLGALLVLIGERMPPRPAKLEGLDNLGDLVKRMEAEPGT